MSKNKIVNIPTARNQGQSQPGAGNSALATNIAGGGDEAFYRKLKQDFPILNRDINGKRLVFLDSAASSQKPRAVIDRLRDYYENEHANIHRGVYYLSQQATIEYEKARRTIADFVKSPCAKSVIFTRGATEGINFVAQTWGRENIKSGDEILLSRLEHHSNIVPWQILAREKGAFIKYIPLKEDDTLDLDQLDSVLTNRTKILAVGHMSNVTGTINPVEELTKIAKEKGIRILIDGAQGACHLPLNLSELGCDFYVTSGHKMLGPTGIGFLYIAEELLEEIPPYHGGGDMIEMVYDADFTTAPAPQRFEAGTPNIAGAIAFAEAVKYLDGIGMDRVRQHEIELTKYAIQRLDDLGFVRQFGPRDMAVRGGVCSFVIDKIHPHDVGHILDEHGISIRAGHHCAQLFMRARKIPGTNRASFYVYNTKEDVDLLIQGLIKVTQVFKHVFS